MAKHLASFALIGSTGHRVGTRFVFNMENISEAMRKPHFRWRNHECHADYLEWLMHNGFEATGEREP